MEPITTTQDSSHTNAKHMCAHGSDGHCCDCAQCNTSWWKSHKGHFFRRWISLLFGVLLAFWVGMQLGQIKGYMMATYGIMPMHRGPMMMEDHNQY